MKLLDTSQLQVILDLSTACAERRAGELSVFEAAAKSGRFSEKKLHIIWFCAEGCRRQNEPDGEMAVERYIRTWDYAYTVSQQSRFPTQELEAELSRITEPSLKGEYRCTAVHFRGYRFALESDKVPQAMHSLFTHGVDCLTPQEFYEEYETIHPRENGNGRVGKVLFNWLASTLLTPAFPVEPERFKLPCG
jgi:hypothetical protein